MTRDTHYDRRRRAARLSGDQPGGLFEIPGKAASFIGKRLLRPTAEVLPIDAE